MARYTDIEALVTEMEKRNNELLDEYGLDAYVQGYEDAISKVENAPTADVVPRSEVEEIFEGLMKELREIEDSFEKAANESSYNVFARIEYRACQMGTSLASLKVAELKNKYTEGKK